jgi:uncharacterized protein (TIGR02145 family)
MKRVLLSFLFHFLFLITAFLCGPGELMALDKPGSLLKNQEVKSGFIENKGQIIDQKNNPNPSVLYLLNTPGMNVQLRKGGFSYDLYRISNIDQRISKYEVTDHNNHPASQYDLRTANIQFHRIDINLVNANPNPTIETSVPSSDYLNFYTTGTPVSGIRSVRSYTSVTYKNIYPGIDLQFKTDKDRLFEYNFILQPGADINSIKLKVYGPEKIKSYREGLRCETSLGDVDETIPVCYYRMNDVNVPVKGRFRKIAEHFYGFAVDQIIPLGAVLIIDPIPRRVWATYYGGSDYDVSYVTISVMDGDVIFSGRTASTNNIATAGSFQPTFAGGWDLFIAKMTPAGQRLWGTYFGGLGTENGRAFKTDNLGNIYVAGNTDSTSTNLASPGAYQTAPSGQTDCFLGKFNGSGFRVWSTYYGGSDFEENGTCSVDNNGNVYLCGTTNSTDGIATSGSYQPTFGGGSDAFLVKFDSTGQRLWGTYYGGTKGDEAMYCDADGNDHVILGGITNSPTNIATPAAFQPTLGNPPVYPGGDGFLVLFNGSGQRQWGTYYGGTEWDGVEMCEIGPDHFLYIGGETESPNQMSSPNGFQTVFGGNMDIFLAKFNLSGVRIWGTYYGGTGYEEWGLFDVDDSSNVFQSGNTFSSNNISTPGAYQPTLIGNSGIFLVKFDSLCHRIWGTYYSDTAGDGVTNCAVTGDTIYLAGAASNSIRLVTPDAYQPIFGGGTCDGLVVKFADCNAPDTADQITGSDNLCFPDYGEPYTTDPIQNATSYLWDPPPGTSISSGQGTTTVNVDFGPGAVSGWIRVRGVNACGPGERQSRYIHLRPIPVPPVTGDSLPCLGENKTYQTLPGKTQYQWNVSAGGTNTGGGTNTSDFMNITWNVLGTQWVSVSYTDTNNCSALNPTIHNVTVTAGAPVGISISASQNNVCAGTSVTFTATPTNGGSSPSYQWKVNGINQGTNNSIYSYIPANGDLVTCVLTSNALCVSNNPATSNGITMVVNPNLPVSVGVAASQNPVCAGNSVTYTATPTNGGLAPSYQWKVNGIGVGTNSITYSYIPANGDIVTCVLTSNAVCATGNPATSNAITMTVNPNLLVSITITASANPFCMGSSVTFTGVPVNGAPTPSFQWQVNGVNVGINSPTYTYNPLNGDLVSCILTSSITCPLGNPATSNTITMVVISNLPAGVTIAASSNPFCPGSAVTFTATPVNGGSIPVYQWKVNGINAGTNSHTFTYNPADNDSVRCVMTSNLSCVTGNPASSAEIIMSGTLAPIVTFTSCFDTITTVNAQPIKLKGGIPLGGIYSGPGVNSLTGAFTPATAGTGTKTITYSYTNVVLCTASKSIHIIVQAAPVFTCGNNLTDIRDAKVYQTVQIGSQCWLASNLNYGTILASSQDQRDNCISEKYCYNDNPTNCANQGGLYQWDELMLYDNTPGDQGFCPPAWHIPTENDWNTLFAIYINNGFAGSPLKYSGYSGFNALLSGVRHINKSWDFQGFATFFWSSTLRSSTQVWAHGMNEEDPSVSIYPASRANAFSVRCVHD